MGLGLIYWICWALALFGGIIVVAPTWSFMMYFVLVAIMSFLLGWKVFGLPITGATQ